MEIDPLRPDMVDGVIHPRNDNVLVRLLPRAELEGYSGPLALPEYEARGTAEQKSEKTQWAEVVALGPRCPDLSHGDRVLVSLMAGDPIWQHGVEHRMVRYAAIICVRDG